MTTETITIYMPLLNEGTDMWRPVYGVDLSPQLHARFKAACAMNRTRMVEEVTRFIEDWTQKHS